VLDPALIVMLAGTGSKVELLARLIAAELVAAFVNVTVQTAACPVPKELGAQVRLDNCAAAAATRLTEKV